MDPEFSGSHPCDCWKLCWVSVSSEVKGGALTGSSVQFIVALKFSDFVEITKVQAQRWIEWIGVLSNSSFSVLPTMTAEY